jgi:hypothetical protein
LFADGGILDGVSDEKSVIIKNCSFDKCVGLKGNGGGIYVVLKSGGNLTVGETNTDTCFEGCEAEKDGGSGGFGGGMFLYCEDDGNSFQFVNLLFDDNSVEMGKNIFIDGKDLLSLITSSTITFSLENSKFDEFVGFDDRNHALFIPLSLFLRGSLDGVVHLKSDGVDYKK